MLAKVWETGLGGRKCAIKKVRNMWDRWGQTVKMHWQKCEKCTKICQKKLKSGKYVQKGRTCKNSKNCQQKQKRDKNRQKWIKQTKAQKTKFR